MTVRHSLCHAVARQDWASKKISELRREGMRQVTGCTADQPHAGFGDDTWMAQGFIQYD